MREESGMTLVEILVAVTIMLIVMFATLSSFDAFGRRNQINNRQTDAIERLRLVADRMAKQLRNLASPTNSSTFTIERAQSDDIIFQTFEPTKRRVRYCLPSAASGDERIYFMTQAPGPGGTTPALPTTTQCGLGIGGGWDTIQRVGDNVVNRRTGDALFNYNWSAAAEAASDYNKITNVRLNIVVDVNSSTQRPSAVRVGSGIDLRNQNQAPTAAFSVIGNGNHSFTLNGSASSDPEGRSLTYFWYRGRTATFTPTAADLIGDSKVYTYNVPIGDIGSGTWYFKLEVRDPGGLSVFCPTNGTGVTTGCSSTAQSF
jgi:type II secretory pathway pseudopilin PulG